MPAVRRGEATILLPSAGTGFGLHSARLEDEQGEPIGYEAIWRLVRRLEQSQLPETFVVWRVRPGS